MAELVFNIGEARLSWPAKGMSWKARSGPFGEGVLPKGRYKIGRREITGYTPDINKSFQDKTGKGFFVPIYPLFATTRGSAGGRLGIHPDGNKPGTNGCIGIIENDTRSFYDAVKTIPPGAELLLEVK